MVELEFLDLTLPTPAENLACDEGLLEWCERDCSEVGLLRMWEPATPFVVLGYGNRAEQEVHIEACRREDVPILRRCSGGGAVLQMPGCLNYTLVLRIESFLKGITEANCWIMKRNAAALTQVVREPVEIQGHTDLAVRNLKISGNSQRRKKRWLLFHGTFLLAPGMDLMEKVLRMPSREPGYRNKRTHREFLGRVPASPQAIRQAMRATWNANRILPENRLPHDLIQQLVAEKYSRDEWNLKW